MPSASSPPGDPGSQHRRNTDFPKLYLSIAMHLFIPLHTSITVQCDVNYMPEGSSVEVLIEIVSHAMNDMDTKCNLPRPKTLRMARAA